MRIRDEYGLQIAEADAGEALAAHRAGRLPPVPILRVPDPPPESWPALARAGFVRKPAWITWYAAAPATPEAYLETLPRKARQDTRRALGHAETAGLRLEVRQPVDEPLLDAFLDLYEERISGMAYGVPFARQSRAAILASERDFVVAAFDGDRLVGGCICTEDPEQDAVRLRFSAVDPRWRAASLSRVLYLHACRAAYDKGHTWATLGNEPNLYGHVAKPGLLFFKSRLGFEPVPAGRFGPARAGDVADLLLGLDELTDPSLMLGYPDEVEPAGGESADVAPAGAGREELVTHVFTRKPQPDLARYTTERVRRVRLVTLPV